MAVDSQTILALAQRFSLPPSLVAALETVQPPRGLLASYGIDDKKTVDAPVVLTVLGHALEQSIGQHGNLQDALSHVLAGDPNAHNSPTSSVSGQITGILGSAAVNAMQDLHSFQPAKPQNFAKVGQEFGKFLQSTADMGGAVSHDTVRLFQHRVASIAPPPEPAAPVRQMTGAMRNAPIPKGPAPSEVEAFASEMKGLGVDVDHFLQHFPLVSGLRYKMLSSHTGLRDYAHVNGLTPPEILEHVRSQPHPTYPHITVGQYTDAKDLADAHSIEYHRRTAAPKDIARFAGTKANWQQVKEHYQARAAADTGVQAPSLAVVGESNARA